MEWLNQIPVDLNGGFISLGILLCSMAIISWIIFWIGKWDRESLPEKRSFSTESRTEQVLIKEMTEITLTDALHHEPSIPFCSPDNLNMPEMETRKTLAANHHHPSAKKEKPSKKGSAQDDNVPLLNPVISSCSFRRLSPQMASILKPGPPLSSLTENAETEAAI